MLQTASWLLFAGRLISYCMIEFLSPRGIFVPLDVLVTYEKKASSISDQKR